MNIVNQTVPRAPEGLGFCSKIKLKSSATLTKKDYYRCTTPQEEHFAVFSCSMGENPIHYLSHVKMMAAVQPFISGAINQGRQHAGR